MSVQDYPNRKFTYQQMGLWNPLDKQEWKKREFLESERISSINDEKLLEIEMSEASNQWASAFKVVESGQTTILIGSVEEARLLLALSNCRFWAALRRLNRIRHRHHLIFVIGGLLVAIVGTIATVLALFPSR